MASHPFSDTLAWQARQVRGQVGSTVRYNGTDYRVIAEKVSDSETGANTLSREVYGVFIACTDSHVFRFSPIHFKPHTDLNPPQEGELLEWHNLYYLITAVTYEDSGDDTHTVVVKAYRKIN